MKYPIKDSFSRSVLSTILVAGILLLGACKKETTAPGGAGGGGASTCGDSFVEFTLNGTTHLLCDDVGLAVITNIDTAFYGLGGRALNLSTQWSVFINDVIPANATAPFEVSNLDLEAFEIGLYNDQNVFESIYEADITGSGSLTFTLLELYPGGWVEGTFNFTDVDEVDEDDNVLSTGNTISNGRFRMPVPAMWLII